MSEKKGAAFEELQETLVRLKTGFEALDAKSLAEQPSEVSEQLSRVTDLASECGLRELSRIAAQMSELVLDVDSATAAGTLTHLGGLLNSLEEFAREEAGRSPAESVPEKSDSGESHPFLDLAQRLEQVDPEDSGCVEEVREELLNLARESNRGEETRNRAAEAMLKLDELLYGDAPSPRESIQKTASLLRESVELEKGQSLDQALESGVMECEEPQGTAPDSLSVDDLAAHLMQIGPNDKPELESIRESLLAMARDESRPEPIRNLAAEAMLKIDGVLYGDDGSDSLSQAIDLIESAIRSQHSQTTEVPEAVPEPQAGEIGRDQEEGTDSPASSTESDGDLEDIFSQVDFELPADSDPDLLNDFVTEATELIEGAEAALLDLEVDPDNGEAVNTVFRAFHTIKGTSGFLGLSAISELAHKAESLLCRVRDGEIRYEGGYADLSLKSVDLLKVLIDSIRAAEPGTQLAKPEGYEQLLGQLVQADDFVGEDEPAPRLGDLLTATGKIAREDVEAVAADQGDDPIGVSLLKKGKSRASDVAKGLRSQKKMTASGDGGESSVRVRTDRLDRLIDMVGELVIAHSMVAQDGTVQDGHHQDLAKKTAQTGKIVRELQDLSMSMRMVPLKPTFQKMARLVRDLSQKAGKRVRFETSGEDTEIDRNMVDVVKDPLVHMVRNAVDHGIESPEVRRGKGKPEEGGVCLSAYHSGGSVVLELKDDGQGLNRERIVEKAVSKGLIESGSALSDSEVFNLVFKPGFSTAEKVTDISGRGVGMDVVRRNIEALRGRVEITSVWGSGTTFTMVLPLTMAITDGMLVRVGEERYIVPITNIVKTFQPNPEQLSTVANRGEMVTLRGELLPVFRLHRLFDIQNAKEKLIEGLLVIVAAGDFRCALLVDELLGQQQVVAKSLGRGIGKVVGLSGGAILGDGRVGLILDTTELIGLAKQETDPALDPMAVGA